MPLFPYLFLLCAKGLSSVLHNVEGYGFITSFSYTVKGPKISQIFFVDDNLLFTRATQDKVYNMRDIFYRCELSSGQLIDF